jgi:antitoxin (DNA-binding transcriptional repressor) of toxin-antitoxin stability system
MRTTLSATEAVRHFSEILNNIKYRGDHYTILRGGKPAAAIVPAEGVVPMRTLAELRGILTALPRLDRDDTSFALDVLAAARTQPPLPESTEWE